MGERGRGPTTRSPVDVTIEVDRLEQLFEASHFDVHDARPRVVAGLEEAFAATRAEHHRRPVRLLVRLPAAAVADLDVDDTRRTVAAYCELRALEVERERDAIVRDGRHSLGTGLVILAVGLIVSQSIHHIELPEQLDVFLADGLFLVVAWVGLWYPIDTLLYSRREAGRRAGAWRSLERADVRFEPLP